MPDTATAAASANPTEHEAALGPEVEALLRRIDERETAEARRGLRAMALAPTLELYHALMRGEHVPLDLLDQDAVKRYGLRR